MLDPPDKKMMPASANKGAPAIHPAFAERFAAGWKIMPGRPLCGGKWVWMKPRGNGFVLHGCICHETPEHR